jgi:PAS domain S-box-containing protein
MRCLTEMNATDRERLERRVREHAEKHEGFARIMSCSVAVFDTYVSAIRDICVRIEAEGHAAQRDYSGLDSLAARLVSRCLTQGGSLQFTLLLVQCFREAFLDHLELYAASDHVSEQCPGLIRELHDVLERSIVREWENLEQASRLARDHDNPAAATVFWQLPEPVLLHSRGGDIMDANPAACLFFGIPVERIRTLRLQDMEAPAAAGGRGRKQAIPGPGEVQSYRTVFTGVRGRRVTCEVLCRQANLDESVFYISTLRDITDMRKQEKRLRDAGRVMEMRMDKNVQRLREINARFQAVLDNSPMALFIVDMDGRHLVANAAWCSMLGKKQDAVLDSHMSEVLPPDSAKAMQDVLAMAERKQDAVGLDARLEVGEKEVRISGTLFPLPDENGAMTACCGMAMDVTRSQRAEERGRALARQNALILNSAGEGIFGMDSERRVTFANPAAAEMLGWEVAEIIGSDAHALLLHSDEEGLPRPILRCPICRVLETARPSRGESILWCKNGVAIPVTYTAVPLRSGVDVEGVVVTFSDISEHKRIEHELIMAKERAELGSQAKTQFLANMSHELRTPLNGILGLVQLMLETERNKNKREYLTMVREASNRLLGLVRNLLDLSNIKSGRIERTDTRFALRQSLSTLVETISVQAKLKSLEFVSFIDESLPEQWYGDIVHIKQALNNLLKNAIQYTPSGRVMLDIREQPGGVDGVRMVRFTVTDTGTGIPEDMQERIFDSFALGEDYLTKKYSGSGVGLSIARKLVDLLGGELNMNSKPGAGSVFSFTAALTPAHREEDLPTPSGLRILYAEDEFTNQRMVQGVLSRAGHEVVLASDGAEALKTLSQSEFDLVLMDIQMPVLDGLETTRRIRKDMKLDLPVIALTAFAGEDDLNRFEAVGMSGLLHKPFELSELLKTLEDHAGAAA